MLNRTSLVDPVLALITVVVFAQPADANRVRQQDELRRERRAGTVRSTHEIEHIILPQMPGMQYLGPEYDATAVAYRLKFIRNGRVVFVDVDARSGRIIGRTR